MQYRIIWVLGLLGILAWPGLADSPPNGQTIPNLGTIKSQIVEYHDSGAYDAEIARVVGEAQAYLATRVDQGGKPAMVLDVDETSLSNWPHMRLLDFGYVPELWNNWEHEAAAWPIQPTVNLYRFARQHAVAVFFITSRPEKEREYTARNLESAGYRGWQGLSLRGPGDPQGDSVVPYKSGVRKKIVAEGYDILLSVGDQNSDLAGGYADKTFKLPNPMYFIP